MTQVAAVAHPFADAGFETMAQRPVDLVHLARHTLGNRDLEREVLQIFVCQSAIYLDRLRSAGNKAERQMAAHTIKGSARGIGAWVVADLAECVEGQNGADGLEALAAAIDKTNRFISALLSEDH